MLRLSTFCMLLAFAAAQSGYEYNKPGKPFSQGNKPIQNNYSPSPGGFQGPATTPSYQYQGVKEDDYSNSGGSTATSPSSSGYPSGPRQGLPNQPGYASQTPSGPSFTGQSSRGPSSVFPGQSVPSYSGQGQNYPEQSQQNYPGQIQSPGPSDLASGQNFPSQLGQTSGTPSQNQPGQTYAGQPGQSGVGGPCQTGSFGFGPSTPDYSQSNAGFGQTSNVPSQTNVGFGTDNTGAYVGGDYSAIPGEPDVDYPILTEIPTTSFRCDAQAYPGYYADVETRCQVFHVCANNKTYDFLCPNGTIFSQQVFVCVWWNQFDCNSAPGLYELNANLYDYSKTGSTSQNAYQPGPNDYSQAQPGQSSYPGGAPGIQGTSANYPGSTGTQGIPNYPGESRPGYPGFSGSQEQTQNYPGASGAPPALPGFSGSQGPSTGYPSAAPQTPPSSYPGAASQNPSNSYLGPQVPSTAFPGSSQAQPNSYTASSPQGTSSSYPGSPAASGSYTGSTSKGSSGYPGSGSIPGSSASYPGSSVAPGFSSSGGVSQDQSSQVPSSYPGTAPSGSLGYPSGKPIGPSFPTGGRPQQPNREYLPPRN